MSCFCFCFLSGSTGYKLFTGWAVCIVMFTVFGIVHAAFDVEMNSWNPLEISALRPPSEYGYMMQNIFQAPFIVPAMFIYNL